MEISRDDVQKLAELTRIDLSDEEVDTYRRDLTEILGYFENLEQVDTSGIPPTARVFEGFAELREDEVQQSLTGEDLRQMAGERFETPESVFVLKGVFETITR
jgi:aspartyl-tRNA(Asn)/glutamyl-tRNA(Gln) amidotransferase subunit C